MSPSLVSEFTFFGNSINKLIELLVKQKNKDIENANIQLFDNNLLFEFKINMKKETTQNQYNNHIEEIINYIEKLKVNSKHISIKKMKNNIYLH
jgi:hypothetical protein